MNHETLYMAIRLVDLYLNNKDVPRDKLQLVAATALFIACKFDVSSRPLTSATGRAAKLDVYLAIAWNVR